MNSHFLIYSLALLFGTFISSISQVLLKKSASKGHDSKLSEYINASVMGAYFLFFCSTLLCIISYRVIPLALGPILESTSYIYIVIFGALFFKEKVTKLKVIALSLILIGIAIFAMPL